MAAALLRGRGRRSPLSTRWSACPDLGEERGHPQVVVHAPVLQGMAVAAGAGQPRPHEDQGGGLGHGSRVAVGDGPVEIGRPDAEIAAVGSEQLADELVVGLVLGDALADPAVIRLRRLRPEIDRVFRLDPQQVAPLQRPEVGELLALQQPVDQLAPLLRIGVGQKGAGLVRRGQRADHVQVDAAQEILRRAQTSEGGMPSVLSLANTSSSILLFGLDRRERRGKRLRDDDPHDGRLPQVHRHDRTLPEILRLDLSLRVHRGDLAVGGLEGRKRA